MYFLWFLLCSTTAKHLQMPDTSDNQRSSSSSSSKTSSYSSESNTIPLSNLGNNYDVETTFIPPSSIDSGGRERNENWDKQYEDSELQSELNRGLPERQNVIYRRQSESNTRQDDLSLGASELSKRQEVLGLVESELSKRQNDISSNGTQSNETSSSTDDSTERDAASSGNERVSDDMIPSSTVISVDSNSIQKVSSGDIEKNDDSRSLKRVFLGNRTIVCNDGSQAGYVLSNHVINLMQLNQQHFSKF